MTSLNLESREHVTLGEPIPALRPAFAPHVDILETASDLRIVADLPGVDEKSVEVTLDHETLTIEGHVQARSFDGYELARGEYEVRDFWRQFSVGPEVGREGIQATVKDGVLTVTLPKSDRAKSHKILVAAA